tara:strand:+ start:86 stop:334 length:249 start_codon:yes stop_codon:yes gene_type:complete
MTFSEAKNYKLRGLRGMYSKYNNCTIDNVASTDAGLLALHDMYRWNIARNVVGRNGNVRGAVKIYLADSEIKSDLENILNQE